jgi:hypothetical protein
LKNKLFYYIKNTKIFKNCGDLRPFLRFGTHECRIFTVGRGDPMRAMKDSGVEWIVEIPEGWKKESGSRAALP